MISQVSTNTTDPNGTNVEPKGGNNSVNLSEGFSIIDKLQSQQTNNIGSSVNQTNRIIKGNDQPVVRLGKEEALNVLNAIEKACDKGKKTELNLDQKTQYVGTVKDLFYKFLGFFSKSLENSKRTQALNAKLYSVATRLKDDQDLYNGVLLSTLNDPKLDALLKTTCFKLYDNDPEIQDKLFKSLKEPPNEIRREFWERNKEKILNGDFFGFKVEGDAEVIKNEFMSVQTEPLKSLFVKNMSTTECKNLNEYRNVFEKSDLPNTLTKEEHIEIFLTSYFSVTREQAETLIQDSKEAGKVGELNDKHIQNCKIIKNALLGENMSNIPSVLLFRELFQGGEKRFTFTVDGRTICDIDKSKLKNQAEKRAQTEKKELYVKLKKAQEELKEAQTKSHQALKGSKKEDAAFKKAERKFETINKNVKNFKPTVELEDFLNEIKTQIKGKNIEKASIEKLALFLASGISLMPPTDQFGRGICAMDRCHCSCVVSKDGTLIINQKFDKVKSAQKGELYTRFRNILDQNAAFKSVAGKCYTETSMEIEHTFKAVGSRNPEKSELKSFDHAVKFSK